MKADVVSSQQKPGTFAQRFGSEGWAVVGPPWLQDARRQAMARFASAGGLPDRRTPGWEHSDARVLDRPYRKADGSGRLDPAVLEGAAYFDESARLVLVDGRFRPDLSRTDGLPPGTVAVDLTSVWGEDAFRQSQQAKLEGADAVALLNLAFLEGGVFVHVPTGHEVEHPIHIVHVHTRPGTATSTKHVVLAGAGSLVRVVESWVGSAPETMTLHTTELIASDGARLHHVKQQLEHARATHKGRVEALVGADAHVATFLWSQGASWCRSGTQVQLARPGASCTVDGLWLGAGSQTHDCPTRIDHQAPDTTSRELYKGILDGESRGIFLGHVVVRPDAQRVDSHQTNRNLLLSKKARVDTTPQLEIHADDVKCGHGSTIGHLDADALFFLRARGIGRRRAEVLLTKAFAGEVLGRIDSWGIRTRLERRLEDWFGAEA